MNELPLSIFEVLLALDLVIIAYSLYKINWDEPIRVDKIIAASISAPLSFILATYSIDGGVVQTFADTNGFHFIPFQSLPVHYFLLGLAVLMGILAVLLITKFISDYFEKLEETSAFGEWK